MLDLGTLRIGVEVDSSEANNQLKQTQETIKSTESATKSTTDQIKTHNENMKMSFKDAASSITGSMEGIASKVASAAKTILAVGTGIFAGLATIGLKYNAEMETYTTNFQVMLGSEEEAVAKVEELKTMASATPFEMSDLADATQTLLQFGIESEDTQGILQQLGDVSLGNQEKFSSLALVYGQVASQGKLMGQDLLQMINAGFNPLQVISEKTSESMESLKEKMSNGEITINEVNQALQWATESGGQFFQGMQQGSQTTEGLISTLKDNVTSKIGELFQGLSDKIQEILPILIQFVEEIDVTAILNNVSAAVQNLISFFQTWGPAIAAVVAAFTTFYTILKAMAIIDTIKNSMLALNAVLAANPIMLVVTALAALVAALITAYNTNEQFRNAVNSAFTQAKQVITTFVNTVVTFFTVTIPTTINNVISSITGFAQSFYDAGASLFNSLLDGIKSIWDGIASFVSEKVQWLTDKLAFWRSGKDEIDGSHRTGLNEVPFDGYIAELHKGEMVLTQAEAKRYRKGETQPQYTQSVVVNNYSPEALNAAETARLYKRSQRELALGM